MLSTLGVERRRGPGSLVLNVSTTLQCCVIKAASIGAVHTLGSLSVLL